MAQCEAEVQRPRNLKSAVLAHHAGAVRREPAQGTSLMLSVSKRTVLALSRKTVNRKIFISDGEELKKQQEPGGAAARPGAGSPHGRIKFAFPALASWTAWPRFSLVALGNLRSTALPQPLLSALSWKVPLSG